jgi:hypothetical protein
VSASPSLYSNQGRKDRSLEFARFTRWTIALRGDRCRVRRRIFEREQIAGLAIEHLTDSGVPNRMALAPPVFDTAPRTALGIARRLAHLCSIRAPERSAAFNGCRQFRRQDLNLQHPRPEFSGPAFALTRDRSQKPTNQKHDRRRSGVALWRFKYYFPPRASDKLNPPCANVT